MASDLKEIILILATITNHSGARWSSLIGGVSEAIESETLLLGCAQRIQHSPVWRTLDCKSNLQYDPNPDY